MEERFLDIEFFRTLLSVLIGGLISLLSVLLVQLVNNKKKNKEDKRLLYNRIITILNQIRRIESIATDHRLAFHFHRRWSEIDPEDKVSQEQANYTLNACNEYVDKLVDKYEMVDSYLVDYKCYFKSDEIFDEILLKMEDWDRPDIPYFTEIDDTDELRKKFLSDREKVSEYIDNYWNDYIEKINVHINKKLVY